jgi:hypothetical protein
VPFGREAVVIWRVEGFTVCVIVPVLEVKLVSPLYSAVMVLAPVPVNGTVMVAFPPTTFTVPRATPLSLKASELPGLPVAGETALTVAVRVTGCPAMEGLRSLVIVVLVLA